MQGITRTDSWSQFVSLVQEARSRNQTVGGAQSIRKTMSQTAVATLGRAPVSNAAMPITRSMISGAAAIPTKTLGSIFDTYA